MAEASTDNIAKMMLQQAEKFWKNQQDDRACVWYEKYFQRVFPKANEESTEITEITPTMATHLLHYAESLLNKPVDAQTDKAIREDDLETAAEYCVTARETYVNAKPEEYEFKNLINTYIFLGRISLLFNKFKQAVNEFTKALTLCEGKDLTWRYVTEIRLWLGNAYENCERPKKGIAALQPGIDMMVGLIEKETDPEKKNELAQHKADLEEVLDRLKEDLKEQENDPELQKEIAKQEEEEEEEEEDAGENAEEEDGEEEEEENEKDGEKKGDENKEEEKKEENKEDEKKPEEKKDEKPAEEKKE